MSEGELTLYSTEDGAATIGLRVMDGTVWLTRLEIAELFHTSKQNISLHINNILSEGELTAESVVKESLTTAADGDRRAGEALAADEADIAQLEEMEKGAKGRKKGGEDA